MPPRAALFAAALTVMTFGAGCDKPAGADESSTKDARKHYHKRNDNEGNGKKGHHNGHSGGGGGGGGGGASKEKFKVGRLDRKAIPESSGVIDSRKYPGVFWTFNDSGN